MSEIIRSSTIRGDFDVDTNMALAAKLADFNNCNIILVSKSFEGKTDKVADWFGTRYKIEPFSDQLKMKMSTPACEIKTKKLDLPPVNNAIPKNFDLLPKDENLSKEPQCIQKTSDTMVWYMKDDKFEVPKAHVLMKIYCPQGKGEFGSVK